MRTAYIQQIMNQHRRCVVTTKLKRMMAGIIAVVAIPFLTGCWYAAAAGAGAAGGYELKKEGYKVQSPVTKEKGKKDTKKESETSDQE